MPGDADLARLGSLLADRTRATMLLVLLAGRPQSASALASAAGVSASLASAHLRKLVEGGLIVVEPVGRHRLFRLANAVADALEGLLLLAPEGSVRSLRGAVYGRNLRRARLCYDHLAGTVGVAVSEAMLRRGLLAECPDGYAVTEGGAAGLRERGVEVARLERLRRPLARPCMDWSERRNHLAGSLGAALMSRFLELRWLRPHEASRVVSLTAEGRRGLRDWLEIEIEETA
ncbi:helix-turn-helix domain-containing protein [Pseudonocardia acaciae]|uniref:helix-turn-helix domain-containing protein n=1 Tax=Pseudonocardia acaciae TaxID=551276 RepID=UPI00048FE230|nr:helix-turn-helix domain-containing protein [Pseudonocardia acaciae]